MREILGTKNETSMTNQNVFKEQEGYTVTEEEMDAVEDTDLSEKENLSDNHGDESEKQAEEDSLNGKPAILYSEDYTVEGDELEAEKELSEKKGFFKGKKGRKRKKRLRIVAVLLVLVIIGVAVGRTFLMRRARSNMIAQSTVRSTKATTGSISTTVVGTGTLSTGDAEDVVVPSGIKIDEVLVETGDTVKKGDTLATVNEASIASALLEIEENLDDVNDQIDDLSDDADEEGTTEYLEAIVLKSEKKELKEAKATLEELLETPTITASKAGIVESVYASEGEELTSSSNSGSSATASASYSSTGSSTVTASYVSYSGTDSNTAVASYVSYSGTDSNAARASYASYSSSDCNVATASYASYSNTISDGVVSRTDGAGTETMGTSTTATVLSSDKTVQAARLTSTSTESNSIEECALSITAPVTGATPETTLEDTDGFTGTISWNPEDNTFQAETVYTATVILTAKDGYVFSEAVNVTISTASGVTTKVSDDGNTLTITATFAATEAVSSESTTSTASSSESTTSSSSSTSSSDSTTSSGSSSSSSNGTADGNGTFGNNTSGGNSSSGSGSVSASSGSGSGSSSSGISSSSDSTGSSSSTSDYSVYEAVAFSIVDDDTAVISVSVDELDILSVEEGQTAVVTMDAVEEEEFEGTITSVSTTSSGDSSSAKYPVEITIEKTDDMMYGMSASVTINIDEATDAILIPVDALQEEGSSTYVYTETDDDGNLSGRTEVTTGLSNGTQVAITSGLEEGDTVYYEEVSSDSDSESGLSFDMNMGGVGNMPSGDRNSSGGSDSNGGGRGNGGGMNGAPSGNQ